MSTIDPTAQFLHDAIASYVTRRLQPVADAALVARQLVGEQGEVIQHQGRVIDELAARVLDLDNRIPRVKL